jgi:hypothetical protein
VSKNRKSTRGTALILLHDHFIEPKRSSLTGEIKVKNLKRVVLVSLSAFTIAPSLAMAASTTLSAFITADDYVAPSNWEYKDIVTAPNSGFAEINISETGTLDDTGLTVDMFGAASAGLGWLRSSSSAYERPVGSTSDYDADFEVASQASWVEQDIVVSSPYPNLDGNWGVAYANVAINGQISSQSGAWEVALGFIQSGPAYVSFETPTGWSQENNFFSNGPGLESSFAGDSDISIVVPIELHFRFGSEFDFGLGLVTLAGATADGDMFAPSWSTVDFGHTLTWGGIDRITDADGNELSGVTFTTASNFDFYAPAIAPAIPEPQTWVMMLAGFGLIGALARKRHLAMR